MKLFIGTVVVLALTGSLALTSANPVDVEVEKILRDNPTLTYLGRVGEKRFFHEDDDVTWYDANRRCKEMGMGLVAIETVEEYEFLKTASYPQFYQDFWTSAVDSLSHANYVWEATGKQIGDFATWQNDDYNVKCVYMTPRGGYWREWGCGYGSTIVCQL